MTHLPITTLAEFDALEPMECFAGYTGTDEGDPEPGDNHSRSYHHGWRCRMMDLRKIETPPEYDMLIRAVADRKRVAHGDAPIWPPHLKVQT